MKKKCGECEQLKDETEFYVGRGRLFGDCKDCVRKKSLESHRKNYYLKKFGIVYETYLFLLQRQDSKCAICGTAHQEKPEKKWGRARLAVDHNHATGIVRGLLCHPCNVSIGLMQESPQRLRDAADYLEKHSPNT